MEQLEEKEERIRHLEAVNITLKQTNDDLNEEVTELRRQLTEQADKVLRVKCEELCLNEVKTSF